MTLLYGISWQIEVILIFTIARLSPCAKQDHRLDTLVEFVFQNPACFAFWYVFRANSF